MDFFSMTISTCGIRILVDLSMRSFDTWIQILGFVRLGSIERKEGGLTPMAKFLEASVSADHNFLPSEYLSYAEEVRNETTKPSTKPSTVII